MTPTPKIFEAVMDGRRDNNILFADLQKLLDNMEFKHRVKGGHHNLLA